MTRKYKLLLILLFILVAVIITSCSNEEKNIEESPMPGSTSLPIETQVPAPEPTEAIDPSPLPTETNSETQDPDAEGGDGSVQVVAEPESITALVNKQFALPESYEPGELVYPDVRFIFAEKLDKRKMRKEAAEALELMFAGAEKDGIYLAGVSAYRSHATQKALFNRYVREDGEEKAKTYSAVPGHSEHETGLAIDISGSDGKCAAEDCFGGTKEAEWLANHGYEYGFIVRYPKGKDKITGYKYEPWHMRYVGVEVSTEVAEKELTLEEYYHALPVANTQ